MAADEPSEVLLELSKIKQEISSGNSRRGEMVLDGLSKLDWGDLIIPGPYSVAVLGQLMALATSESANFGFKTIPLGGFKKIKWPKSFPACMVQLTDEAHSAFKTAHINIEEISLHAEYINNGIKNCLVLIFGESAAEIKKHLPSQLEILQKNTNHCISKAEAVENGFFGAMALIQELLETITNEEDVRNRDNDHVRQGIEAAKRNQEALKKQEEFINGQMERARTDVQKSEENLKKVRANKNSELDLLGMIVGQNGIQKASNIASASFENPADVLVNDITNNPTPSSQPSPTNPQKTKPSVKKQDIEYKVDGAHLEAKSIKSLLSSLQDLADESSDKIVKDTCSLTLQQLELIVVNLKASEQTQNVTDAIALCKKGIEVAKDITDIYQNVKEKKSPKELIQNALKKLGNSVVKANQLETVANNLLGTFTSPPSPLVTEAMAQLPATQNIAIQMVNNYKAELESATICLNEAKNRYENHVNLQRANMKHIRGAIVKMNQLNIKATKFEEIKKISVDAMFVLSELRGQWGKLVQFFSNIASIIGVRMKESLNLFVATVKAEQQDAAKELAENQKKLAGLSLKDAKPVKNDFVYRVSDDTKNILCTLSLEAGKVIFFAHKISTTYHKISKQHLMAPLMTLGEIVALGPTKEAVARKTDLLDKCEKAIKDIAVLIEKQAEEFHETYKERTAEIEKAIKELPKVPETPSYKAIKAAEKETKSIVAQASESVKQPVKKLKSYYVDDD